MLLGGICEYVSLSPYGFVFFELKEFLSFWSASAPVQFPQQKNRRKAEKRGTFPSPNFVEFFKGKRHVESLS